MSAAVIGRQLRQQNTITRTSGPLVPPVYKGRPRTPSVFGRPYSPVATSSGTFAVPSEPISNTYSNLTKPQVTQSRSETVVVDEGPRLRCTSRCFCIALKALSFGIALLTIGAILFVIGFIVENDYIRSQGKRPEQFNADQRTQLMMYRNLTYAGPVVMGLGAVVVVAGLVLTFEERDTLGVKTLPQNQTSSAASKPTVPVVIAGMNSTGQRDRKSTIPSVSSTLTSGLTTGLGRDGRRLGSDMSLTTSYVTTGGVREGMFDRSLLAVQETIQETALSESGPKTQTASCTESPGTGHMRSQQVRDKRPVQRDECCIFTTSSSSGTSSYQRHTSSIEQACLGIESPMDMAISDPEACSLRLPDHRRSTARCSCSASPTFSQSEFDLILPDDPDDHSFKHQLYHQQQELQHRLLQHQQRLIQQQQQQLQAQQRLLQEQKQKMNRRPPASAVAFIESDSLSSASSSTDNLFIRHPVGGRLSSSAQPHHRSRRNKSQTCYTTVKVHHHDYDTSSEASAPLLHPNDAIRRSTSSHKQEFQLRNHDKRLPLLRPPQPEEL